MKGRQLWEWMKVLLVKELFCIVACELYVRNLINKNGAIHRLWSKWSYEVLTGNKKIDIPWQAIWVCIIVGSYIGLFYGCLILGAYFNKMGGVK